MGNQADIAILGIEPPLLEQVLASVEAGRVVMLAVSGRLASGKDTIAALAMEGLGYADAQRLSVGKNICAEGDQVVAAIRAAEGNHRQAATLASQSLGIPPIAAERAVDLLWEATVENGLETTLVRHPAVRPALEFIGSVRRQQDSLYWIKPVMRAAVHAAVEGRSCYLTDVRTPEEVVWAKRLGFVMVRIDITTETQRRRLAQRDGSPWKASLVSSPLERALDDSTAFDLRVDNNDDCWPSTSMQSVIKIIEAVKRRQGS